MEFQSIDFAIDHRRNGSIGLHCMGNGDEFVFCREARFDDETHRKLLAKIAEKHQQGVINYSQSGASTKPIVELAFDVRTGRWQFHTFRDDKNRANHISIAFDTMEAIAENITKEELLYRVPRTPQADKWDAIQQDMRHKMREGLFGQSSGSRGSGH